MRILLFLLLALSVTACSDPGRDYLPLPTTGTLTYALTETTSGNSREQKLLTAIHGPLTINDQQVYQQLSANGPERLLQKNDNGIVEIAFYRSSEPLYREKPILVLPQPLQTDSRWRAPVTTRLLEWRKHSLENAGREFRHTLMADYHCENIGERIKTPAGIFNDVARITITAQKTIEYGSVQEQSTIHVEMTQWYAPGIGLIKGERKEYADSRELNPGHSSTILERID